MTSLTGDIRARLGRVYFEIFVTFRHRGGEARLLPKSRKSS